MRHALRIAGIAVACLALSAPAFAQRPPAGAAKAKKAKTRKARTKRPAAKTKKTTVRPPAKQKIRPVERGLFVETDIGLTLPVTAVGDRDYALGVEAAIHLGYDVLPMLSLMAGVSAVVLPGDDTVTGPRGDLVVVAPMVHAQFALITTARNHLWVRGGAGFGLGFPDKLGEVDIGGNGPLFSASAGFEHYTRLRHFSIGVRAGAVIVTTPSVGIGVSVTPLLKYTF